MSNYTHIIAILCGLLVLIDGKSIDLSATKQPAVLEKTENATVTPPVKSPETVGRRLGRSYITEMIDCAVSRNVVCFLHSARDFMAQWKNDLIELRGKGKIMRLVLLIKKIIFGIFLAVTVLIGLKAIRVGIQFKYWLLAVAQFIFKIVVWYHNKHHYVHHDEALQFDNYGHHGWDDHLIEDGYATHEYAKNHDEDLNVYSAHDLAYGGHAQSKLSKLKKFLDN